MKTIICLFLCCAMAYAGDLSGYAIASPLATAPIATSYSSISKINSPLAAPIAIGTPLAYTSNIATPIAAPLAATPIAYKASAVPIVSSYGYGASIATPLAYKTPLAASYGYGLGSPILTGGYIGSKYY